MLEYAYMYLNEKSSEYVRVLNVSDAHSIRSLYKLVSSYQDRHKFRKHYQTFKMQHFAKRIMHECKHATRNFSWQGKFHGTSAFQ